MLDNRGFDLWADDYDRAVSLSEEEDSYPFAGYRAVLGDIYRQIMDKPGASVLDIGFGTGTLTAKLYGQGCEIYGQDFSARMLALAREKMPGAHLYQGDFSRALAAPLRARRYDFIVATYSLHHLTDERKISLITELLELLTDRGTLLIGDIAFADRAELENCRRQAGDEWDEDEIYFVYDELKRTFPKLTFSPKSRCAGVLTLRR
ncbi:MAG: class I SAM-dependent methyltransferase [Oscillospiraceae bacterium]|nr:class I SAM-dependent methyltransferase [Oscillospiraceae bacterium]